MKKKELILLLIFVAIAFLTIVFNEFFFKHQAIVQKQKMHYTTNADYLKWKP